MKVALAAATSLVLVACGGGGGGGSGGGGSRASSTTTTRSTSALSVSSIAFTDGGALPGRYTCDGAGFTPPLVWSGTPTGTVEVAVSVVDPDAPTGTFYHWALFGLPASTSSLAEGSALPPGARQATSSSGRIGWVPPCPPTLAAAHHYHFTIYALRGPDGLENGAPAAHAVSVLEGLSLAKGELVGTYKR